jgi:glycerol-3-phosphate O-acyltransferase/dihydroxyacetone phosphate acyltransferase
MSATPAEPHAPRRYPAYELVRALMWLCLRVFYTQVRVVGRENIPPEGAAPVIFAGNHPNSLLDPALVITTCRRQVHFAAKDVLFRSPPLKVIMDALGVVPISRRKDHPDGPLDNSATFAALHEVLAEGRAMGIFPEGISHESTNLARLKTGAARIGLELVEQRPELPVMIVPVGLTYIHRRRFRSRVLVQYGEPIPVAEHLAAWREDPHPAARQLTDRVDAGLRALTVNSSDWDTLRVLDGVRRLYQPPRIPLEHRVELSRRFNEHYPSVRNDPEVIVLYKRVERYLDELDVLGLSDEDLDDDANLRSRRQRAARNVMLVLLWLPLALPGFVVFAPVGQLVSMASHSVAPRKDVIATTKFVLGILGIIAGYGALVLLVALAAGWGWGLALLTWLPLSAWATLEVLECGASLQRLASSGARSLLLSRQVEQLKQERRFLEVEVLRAVNRLIPEDMQRLYNPAPEGMGS